MFRPLLYHNRGVTMTEVSEMGGLLLIVIAEGLDTHSEATGVVSPIMLGAL